ncbi:MAG: hypothetical protein LBS91_09260 [Clostridiales Family XIII bacterium]|jgi:hypothetical protein|nr:hypothetical protein [Clostridiales Family XIII bacterium]
MGIPAMKIDFEKEMERRREDAVLLQTKLDVEELNRRVRAAQEGTSRLLTEEESETMLRDLGYYD